MLWPKELMASLDMEAGIYWVTALSMLWEYCDRQENIVPSSSDYSWRKML